MLPRTKSVLILLAAMLPTVSWAQDYRSVSVPKAVLYDAPSTQAKKLYIVSQQYPVEVIVNLGDWIKVRDMRGELAWIDAKQLSSKRSVVVVSPQTEVHESAYESSRLIFRADKDVALELVESGSNGWAKVRHRDGLAGYVQISKVWGL